VWRSVYAAGVKGELSRYRADGDNPEPNISTLGDWAESHAWEAVRRANGGEMPEEASTSSEPTDEEMAEALAPIVAAHDRKAWERAPVLTREVWIRQAKDCLRGNRGYTASFVDAAVGAVASWKAARAWGRK
jgi:hypothetical protein